MKKTSIFLIILSFVFCAFSCVYKIDFASLEVYFNDTKISDENPQSFTINLDTQERNNLILDLKIKLYKYADDGFPNEGRYENKYKYDFSASSSDIKFLSVGNSGFETRVDFSSVPVGTYRLYAKSKGTSSKEWSNFTYTITITSGLQNLQASYSLDSAYRDKDTSYTDEELEGVVFFKNNQLNLVANSSYSFEVSDYTGKIQNISSLIISSSDELNTEIQYTSGTSYFKAYFSGSAKDKITLNISVAGMREVYLQLNITLVDKSRSSLALTEQIEEKDVILSFVANPSDYQNKEYTYNLNTSTPQYIEKQPVFSIDVEDWSEDEELRFNECKRNHTKFTPKLKENPTWYTATEFLYTYNGTTKFKIRVDGTTRSVIITPLSDTISYDNTYNLHAYLYWKWKDENSVVYRGKYRIMVGGILDGLSLIRSSLGNEDDITEKELEIKPGDNTGFDVVLTYLPSNIRKSNNKVLCYLAKGLNLTEYKLNNTLTLSIPAPLRKDTAEGKTLDLANSVNNTDTIRDNSYFLIDTATNENIIIPYYALRDMTDGFNSVWLRYNQTGEKVYFIAVDIQTGLWTYFSIKQTDSTGEVINKCLTPAPSTLYLYHTTTNPSRSFYSTSSSLSKNSYGQPVSNTKTLKTTYNGTEIQAYPKTIQEASEKYRTFFLNIDEEIDINIDTNFDIETISVQQTADSSKILLINEGLNNPIKARISLSTLYYSYEDELKTQIRTKGEMDKYLSGDDGVFFNIILNDNIILPYRIIVYK